MLFKNGVHASVESVCMCPLCNPEVIPANNENSSLSEKGILVQSLSIIHFFVALSKHLVI